MDDRWPKGKQGLERGILLLYSHSIFTFLSCTFFHRFLESHFLFTKYIS